MRRLSLPLVLAACCLVGAPRAWGQVRLTLGSGEAIPGATLEIPIRLTPEAGVVVALDLTLEASSSGAAPPLADPAFLRGAATSAPGGWTFFAQPNPWRCVFYDSVLRGVQGEAEILRLRVTVPATAVKGTVYTLAARSATLSDPEGWEARGASLVGAGRLTVGNRPPVAEPVSVTGAAGASVRLSLLGSDPDGDPLTYTVVAPPARGTLSGAPPHLTYTADPGFAGEDSFLYTVSDGAAVSGPARVLVTLAPNAAPRALAQSVTTQEDTPVAIELRGQDPESQPLHFTIATPPQRGTLSGQAPHLLYTPHPDTHGSDAFTFTVSDPYGESDSARVSLEVTPVNDPPRALPVTAEGSEDTPLTFLLWAEDVDGDALRYEVLEPPPLGVLEGEPPRLTYQPPPNFSGSVSFRFRATDGQAASPPAAVLLRITPVDDPPAGIPLSVTTRMGAPVSLRLAGADPDGDPLRFAIDTLPRHGALAGGAPHLTYTPAAGYVGEDSFTFVVRDGRSESPPTQVTITIAARDQGAVELRGGAVRAAETLDLGVWCSGLEGLASLAFTVTVAAPPGAPPLGLIEARPGALLEGAEAELQSTAGGWRVTLHREQPAGGDGEAALLRVVVPAESPSGAVYQVGPQAAIAALADPAGDLLPVTPSLRGCEVTVLPRGLPGDANGDGFLDVRDALLAIRLMLRLSPEDPEARRACDLNGDGSVTVVDVVLLVRALLGLSVR